MLMKYKDFKKLSAEEMTLVKGGFAVNNARCNAGHYDYICGTEVSNGHTYNDWCRCSDGAPLQCHVEA